jgi:phage terminase small subunit
MSSNVTELREEVLKLRGEGLSFSKVAKQLAISKAYAVKLAQSDRSQEPDTGHKNGHQRSLTVRQRRFAAELAQGKTQRQAALDAGSTPGGADDFAQRTLKNPQFQESFAQLLDRMGLSDQRLAEIHAENLQATKVVAVGRNMQGAITEVLEKPDFSTRQRAVKDAWVLRGRMSPSGEEGGQPLQINILLATARKIEKLVGRPILSADFESVENGPAAEPTGDAGVNSEPPSNGGKASPDGTVWGDW